MIFLRVTDNSGEIIINSFPNNFEFPNTKEEKKGLSRYLKKDLTIGNLEVFLNKEYRISNSNKVFNAFISALEKTLELAIMNTLEKTRDKADDYLHNIIKIHGNQKSIIERCVDGAEGQENYNNFVLAVEEKIRKNQNIFAEDICALSKEIRLVDFHIGGYKLLHDKSSRISITHNHNLKKFLLGLLHLFYESFNKNNIKVSLHDVDEDFLCSLEHETFNIAMHCFMENMVKYVKPYTKAKVYTENNDLIFEMESIRIEKDEVVKIFDKGVFGRCVPEFLRGSGLGMYQLKKALERNNISISVFPNLSENSEVNGIKYTKNKFSFSF